MPTPIDATKSALRAQVIAARDAVDEGERARKSRAICDRLKAHAEEVAAGRKGLTVTAFRAMGSEVYVTAAQLDDEVDAFFKHPMKSYASADPLLAESPLCEPEAVDLAVVPMVAFDDRRFRLGYGGGCYDRFLPRLGSQAHIAGVAFEEQLVDCVPTDEHDVQLPRIFTA